MPLPLLPILVSLFGAAAWHQASKKDSKGPGKGVLTAERQHYYETAMKELQDPDKLRELARTYREQGLPAHADMLEKRANLRALPENIKLARREVYKKAMKSTDATAIRNLANVYEQQGATGAAKSLRDYAASLPVTPTGNIAVPPIAVQPEMPPVIGEDDIPETHGELTEEETLAQQE